MRNCNRFGKAKANPSSACPYLSAFLMPPNPRIKSTAHATLSGFCLFICVFCLRGFVFLLGMVWCGVGFVLLLFRAVCVESFSPSAHAHFFFRVNNRKSPHTTPRHICRHMRIDIKKGTIKEGGGGREGETSSTHEQTLTLTGFFLG